MQRVAAVMTVAMCLLATGCLTARQQAMEARSPQNSVFLPGSTILPLAEGQPSAFAEINRTKGQNVCLLRLAANAKLTRRYHADHDLVLVCSAGSGVVMLEEVRQVVVPGSVVIIPRMTAYTIIPGQEQPVFTAVLIYAPPFDGQDTYLEE
jgi:mannose-6-phosphate isomerase-like protein (cupin superfamily)